MHGALMGCPQDRFSPWMHAVIDTQAMTRLETLPVIGRSEVDRIRRRFETLIAHTSWAGPTKPPFVQDLENALHVCAELQRVNGWR